MKERLTKLSESFQNFIFKYDGLIEQEIDTVSNKLKIDLKTLTLDSLYNKIEEMEKVGKLLQIGIVGGVKAGKSSILNALIFDGKPILPKAATPMTASLTTLSYGEELEVNIEYFTKEDLLDIEKKANEYKSEFEKRTEKLYDTMIEYEVQRPEEIELEKIKNKAKNQVTQEMKKDEYFQYLKFAYDHFYMEGSDQQVDVSKLPQKIFDLEFFSLSDQLKDFVGAKGKYTKHVKAVNIKIPVDIMKNLIIVDSPGINDPVESREKRTMELIKECDVIFLISRASQFLPKSDMELLERIQSIEGINEIYLIASQSDLALIGSIKEDNGGDPFKSIEKIKEVLEESVMKNNIQIGNKKIIVSSGGCYSLASKIEQQDSLDSNEETIKDNLFYEYSEYFSDQSPALVDRLKNISKIDEIVNLLEKVRDKKDIILHERVNEFILAKVNLINKFIEELKNINNMRIGEIESNDLDSLKLKKKALNTSIESKKENIKSDYNDFTTKILKDIPIKIDNSKDDYTKNILSFIYVYFKQRKENITANGFWDIKGHWESFVGKTRDVLYVDTISMNSKLISSRKLTQSYRNTIRMIYEKYRDNLLDNLSESISPIINDFKTNEKYVIKNKLDDVYKTELEDKIKIKIEMPENKYNGNLRSYQAEKYREDIYKYIKSFNDSIEENLEIFEDSKVRLIFENIDLTKEILSSITEEYILLEKEILDKENSLIQRRIIKDSLDQI